MKSLSEQLATLNPIDREKIIASLNDDEAHELLYDWQGFLARPEQLPPKEAYDIWMILSGRGWGKTRTGAEWVRDAVNNGYRRIALVAETAADARDVIVEGKSGILACYPENEQPLYEPSKRRLTWRNGAVASLFNGTEPDQLRGPQFDLAWVDELAKFRYARETWDMLQFGLRLGNNPKVLVTTTPRPIEVIKAILAGKEGRVIVTRGKTSDNASNLAASFLTKITDRYANTRLGRQELDGEILGDIPNALWSMDSIDSNRIKDAPEDIGRIVVGVDPAITNTEESDYHGIVVAGLSKDNKTGYVLADGSRTGTPMDWARRAVALFDQYQADAIVVEVNQGGDMVANTLRSVRSTLPIIEVRATKGKHVRAEPVSSLYEQKRIHHVGAFADLENQMTQMTSAGYEGDGSPDRVDALVWAFTSLFGLMTRETIKPHISPPKILMPAARR